MYSSSKALKEVHKIMERIYESQKGKSKEEIIKDFHESAEKLIKEKGLKLKVVEKN